MYINSNDKTVKYFANLFQVVMCEVHFAWVSIRGVARMARGVVVPVPNDKRHGV